MRALVFGASISQGYYDSQGGWVDRWKRDEMARRMDSGKGITVFNLATSGDTSADVRRRIHDEIAHRVWTDEEMVVIVPVGTNDSMISGSNEKTPQVEYANNLRVIVDNAREFTKNIIFVELPPCDESRTNPVSWGDYNYSNERLKVYNQTMNQIAAECDVTIVRLFDEFTQAQQSDELLYDGLHPNDKGHELIYNEVKKKLAEIL